MYLIMDVIDTYLNRGDGSRVLRASTDAECNRLSTYDDVSMVTLFFCCLQIIAVSLIYCYMTNNRYFLHSLFRGHGEVIVLPVYNNALVCTTFFSLGISIARLINYPDNSVLFYSIKWFVNRFLTDGLSIFLMHNGVGKRAVQFSVIIAAVWASVSAAVSYIIYLQYGLTTYFGVQMCLVSIMGLFYVVNWLAPNEKLHRRPALILLSRYYSFVFLLMFSSTFILLFERDTSGCAVNIFLSVGELLMPILIFRAIYQDSLFWQGLFVRGTDNLNEPLLGMWDMGRETMDIVAQSITDLEKQIVPIIPFGMLFLDTSHYFSGGSARVYRGRYMDADVAIKFLFCIELTPERVVAFCHEATILNSLQHPNVVKCHGVSVMPPALCLVTEFCTFGSLFDFLHSVDTASDSARSETSSRTSSRPSVINLLRGAATSHGDSMKDDIDRESGGMSDLEAGTTRYTDHSLSRHSLSAIMIKLPSSSTVISVPERFSLSAATPLNRKTGNAAVLDTVTEKSVSEYSMDVSLASTSQFYNQNIINNLPNTIAEADSYGMRSVGHQSGSNLEVHISSGNDLVQSGGSATSSTGIKKLKSAVDLMRNSFLGLGLGPAGAPKAPRSKLTASSRPR